MLKFMSREDRRSGNMSSKSLPSLRLRLAWLQENNSRTRVDWKLIASKCPTRQKVKEMRSFKGLDAGNITAAQMDILNSIPFTLTQQIDEKYIGLIIGRQGESINRLRQNSTSRLRSRTTRLLSWRDRRNGPRMRWGKSFLLLTSKKKRIAMFFIKKLIRIECFNFDLKHRFLIIFIKSRNRIWHHMRVIHSYRNPIQ